MERARFLWLRALSVTLLVAAALSLAVLPATRNAAHVSVGVGSVATSPETVASEAAADAPIDPLPTAASPSGPSEPATTSSTATSAGGDDVPTSAPRATTTTTRPDASSIEVPTTLPPVPLTTSTTAAPLDLLDCRIPADLPNDDPLVSLNGRLLPYRLPVASTPADEIFSNPREVVGNCRPLVGDVVGAVVPATPVGMILQTGTIDWGDGQRYDPGQSVCSWTSALDQATHRYARPGRYLLRAVARPCEPVDVPLLGVTSYSVFVDVTAGVVPGFPGAPCTGLGPSLAGEPPREGRASVIKPKGDPASAWPSFDGQSVTLSRCSIRLGREAYVSPIANGLVRSEVDWGDGSPRATGGRAYNHTPARRGSFIVTVWPLYIPAGGGYGPLVRGTPVRLQLLVT